MTVRPDAAPALDAADLPTVPSVRPPSLPPDPAPTCAKRLTREEWYGVVLLARDTQEAVKAVQAPLDAHVSKLLVAHGAGPGEAILGGGCIGVPPPEGAKP